MALDPEVAEELKELRMTIDHLDEYLYRFKKKDGLDIPGFVILTDEQGNITADGKRYMSCLEVALAAEGKLGSSPQQRKERLGKYSMNPFSQAVIQGDSLGWLTSAYLDAKNSEEDGDLSRRIYLDKEMIRSAKCGICGLKQYTQINNSDKLKK